MKQEDKIKEFIESGKINDFISTLSMDYMESGSSLTIQEVIIRSIKYGSTITAERAKEKVEAINKYPLVFNNGMTITVSKGEVLQAIEESVIK